MNTKRPVITPATDTTDAVMESDTSLRLRAQRAYDGLSVAGPSGAYEYFARSASGLVRDARAISPSPANVTVSILSTEGDGTATEALLNTVRAVLNAEDTRPVADRLTVQSARIVTWRLNAKLYFYPGPESEPILAAAESSFRKWLAEQGLIGQDVALSAIAAALHVHGVQRVEIIEPTQNMAISDIQAARCVSHSPSAKVDAMSNSLLPPSASNFMRCAEAVGTRITDIPVDLNTLVAGHLPGASAALSRPGIFR